VAVRLFVGNMPYGATEADLRAHFSGVGAPSQIVIPVDRETGRPRGFAFVEFMERPVAEEAITRFNQQPFMGRTLSVSEARPREAGGGGGGFRPSGGPGGGGFSGPRPGGFSGPPRPGGFSGPRPGGFGGPPAGGVGAPGKNFGPPKKKSASSEKRWENKERGPKGPIKERYTGRLGGLYDDPNDTSVPLTDFDDPAMRAENEDEK
jgi:cold-inducible RNA-binding protein